MNGRELSCNYLLAVDAFRCNSVQVKSIRALLSEHEMAILEQGRALGFARPNCSAAPLWRGSMVPRSGRRETRLPARRQPVPPPAQFLPPGTHEDPPCLCPPRPGCHRLRADRCRRRQVGCRHDDQPRLGRSDRRYHPANDRQLGPSQRPDRTSTPSPQSATLTPMGCGTIRFRDLKLN
jgi:hypothetical protein